MAVRPGSHQAFGHVLLQVGACIVNAENKIVGIGYNGMPNGCSDDLLPWRRTAERKLDTKYPYGRRAWHPALLRSESVFPLLSQQQLERKKETLLNDPNFLFPSLKFQREPVSGREPGGGIQLGPEGRGSVACVAWVCFHGKPPAVPARALVVASVPRAAALGGLCTPGRTVRDGPAGWKQSRSAGMAGAWRWEKQGLGRRKMLWSPAVLGAPQFQGGCGQSTSQMGGTGPLGLAVCFVCLN